MWPVVKLGEVLTERREVPSTDALVNGHVRMVSKISFNTGHIEFRSDAKTNTGMILAYPGDLLISGINATKGAIAVYGSDNAKTVAATIHYSAYTPNLERIDIKYLWWFLRSQRFQELLVHHIPGGIKTELKAKRFLPIPIPLPPLAEQRRIVARIVELAAQINDALELRGQAVEAAEALLRGILSGDKSAKATAMKDLVKLRSPDIVVSSDETYQFAGVYSFGRGVFKAVLKSGNDFAYPRLTRLKAGEFVYPKLMAWEGALGVVPPECDGYVVSTEFPVFSINEDRVLPEVLDTYFRTPNVWPELAGVSTGTNVRRRRLNPGDFLNYKLPLPSMQTQKIFRKIKIEADALKRLQAETAADLDALLPAVLDRAFKGKL
jgi:type I restriction enzyme S subunit